MDRYDALFGRRGEFLRLRAVRRLWSRLDRLTTRRRFMVRLHGRHIGLTLEGRGPTRAGFLATRIVDAESAEEANHAALAVIIQDLESRGALPFDQEPLTIEVESTGRVPWWSGRLRPLGGFTFYASEGEADT